MTGEEIATATAYEHSGGYQPPRGGLSPRRFLFGILGVALFLAGKWLLETYVGNKTAEDLFQLAIAALAIPATVRAILLPEPLDYECTAAEARKAHIWGTGWMIAWLIAATVLATLSIRSLVFAA